MMKNSNIYKVLKKSISNYIVSGYHANTPVPKEAINAGLKFRFALVLDSHYPDQFDASFFLTCLTLIAKNIDYDNITIHINGKKYKSIETLNQTILETSKLDREPPETIYFKKDEKLICFEETEFWVFCGGDQPYSDSYTFSFYTENNMAEVFTDSCLVACKTEDAEIKEIIQAQMEPIKSTILEKN